MKIPTKLKPILVGVGLITIVVAAVSVVAVLLRHEPAWYRNAEVPPGQARKVHSVEFIGACAQLYSSYDKDAHWYGRFTVEQINSYLAENFVTDGTMEKLVPSSITEPRLVVEDGKVRLGFRYGKKPWSTIITVDIRVWVVPKEYNLVALEVEGIHAGRVPISVQSMLQRIGESLRAQQRGLEFSWYRNHGHPVALLRLQADKAVPSVRLQQVGLKDGALTIAGCDFAGAPAPGPAPAAATPERK